jgi:hypothetical protein
MFNNSPFMFYAAVGLGGGLVLWGIRRVFMDKDIWRQAESMLGIIFGGALLLTTLGPDEGLITRATGEIALIISATLLAGVYFLCYGIVCVRKKRILTDSWKKKYATGPEAVKRGWAFIVLGSGALWGFVLVAQAYFAGDFP